MTLLRWFAAVASCWFACQRAVTVEVCSGELREGSPNQLSIVVVAALAGLCLLAPLAPTSRCAE